MTNPNKTEIVFVLDRSGSMTSIRADMEGGFNQLIADQRKVPGDCVVTLVQFDTEYEVVYSGLPLDNVPPLSLVPRGGTALLDALGIAVTSTGRRLAGMAEHERPGKVIFVVITDGQENSSHEYTKPTVLEMIKHQRERYAWDFVFLGADANAIDVAQSVGIVNAAVYGANAGGTAALYSSVSSSIGSVRIQSGAGGAGGATLNYNQATYDSHLADTTASGTIATPPVTAIVTPDKDA